MKNENLVGENLNLVYMMAQKVKNYLNMEFDDIVGYGMIGLVKAAERFDITKGFKFSTYACAFIRGEILNSARKIKVKDKEKECYFDDVIKGPANEETTFADRIDRKIDIENALNILSDTERIVLENIAKGYKQEEVGKMANVSQATVSRIYKRAKLKMVSTIEIYV